MGGRWGFAFGRARSRFVLLAEYARRAALWARACSAEEVWPFFDVTSYVAPEFVLAPELDGVLPDLYAPWSSSRSGAESYYLVPLLEEIQRPDFSEAEVFWGSDTFSAEWRMAREGDSVRIQARWHSTLGNYESLLAERGDMVARARVFVSEWAKILRRIVTDIEAESVELDDDDIFLRTKALLAA
ncbi:hypothetical protein [Streptomyces sp. NPDC059564]|uniref:hypothetical protein n=1 Tax=Streptomyces sp. NPDC059564 TaxID=3346865 RepID=UPI0036A99BA3